MVVLWNFTDDPGKAVLDALKTIKLVGGEVQGRIQEFGMGGGPNGRSFGNRRETRGGSREGGTPPWVRGPGRSPGNFRIYRSLYVSFSVL